MSAHATRQLIFLFSDIEASTKLWELFPDEMQAILAMHDSIVRSQVEKHSGEIIKHTGDGFFSIFSSGSPLQCAIDILNEIAHTNWSPVKELRVRLSLHAGFAEKRGADYFGVDINRTARLLSAGWGGQILLTPDVLEQTQLPHDAELHDFGKHLLKDLGEPQQIYGLIHPSMPLTEFPPLRTLTRRNHNLPINATPFVGRERELEEIKSHIIDTPCRLLTLAGPGGMGKTRLAMQAAAICIDSFEDGVFFTPLASVESSDFVITSIASALGFNFYEESDSEQQLLDYLEKKDMLLILDNFEHVMDASRLIAEILQDCRSIKMIITSRERLQIQGEWVYPILGLTYPKSLPVDDAESYGAIQLFAQGARRAEPHFDITEDELPQVINICSLVQGMPLAVELASAWVGVLSTSEIAEEIERNHDFLETQMHGVPERHRSLRAVFEYSWQLLSKHDREMFRKLSVFRGGFTRRASREIAGASVKDLESLMRKSLLRRDDTTRRFLIIDALIEFATEKLREDEALESKINVSHATYYLEYLSSLEPNLKGSQQKETLNELNIEIENLRKAWHTGCDHPLLKSINASLSCLSLFYEMRSWFVEGAEMFKRAAEAILNAQAREEILDLVLARIMSRQAVFCHRLGKSQEAQELLNKSLELIGNDGNLFELALIYNNLANIAFTLGDGPGAFQLHEKSLEIRKSLGDDWAISTSLSNLGVLEARNGNRQRARELFEESLQYRRAIGDRFGIATSLNNLGVIASELGEFEQARQLHTESLKIRKELEDQKGITESLSNLGVIADALGEYDDSISLYEESLSISESIGDKYASARTLNNLGYAAYNLGEYEYALQFCRRALKLNEEILNKGGIAVSLNGMANSESELGHLEAAEKHFLSALRISATLTKNQELHEILIGIGLLFYRQKKYSDASVVLHIIAQEYDAERSVRENAEGILSRIPNAATSSQNKSTRLNDIDSLETLLEELIRTD